VVRRRKAIQARALPGEALSWHQMLGSVVLWLMLWGGYNTEYGRIFETDFPSSYLDLLHGLRAWLPLLAGFFAALKMLYRRPLPFWPLRGPLGMMGIYAVVGGISSVLRSPKPAWALWWAGEYASVLLVIWAILIDSRPLSRVLRLIKLNWAIVLLIGAAIAVVAVSSPSVELSPGGVMHVESVGDPDQILGMAATRSTGVGRYAAIAGLVALANVWGNTKRSRSAWLLVLLLSVSGLVYLQARTAFVSFLVGAFVVLWLRRASRVVLFLSACLAAVVMAATGYYEAVWLYWTKGAPFDPTFTGRTTVWQQGWTLFLQSPLIGLGFHADRIFLENKHMHDALLHALVQTGFLGVLSYVGAVLTGWVHIFRLYLVRSSQSAALLPVEVPGVIVYLTVASVTESTFAIFSVPLLLLVPCLTYLQVLIRQRQRVRWGEAVVKLRGRPWAQPGLAARSSLPRKA